MTPFVLAVLILAASSIVVFNLSARGQDRIAAKTSETLVRALVSKFERDLDRLVFDNSWWDQAVENIAENLNADWADLNIGDYATETFDVSESFVLSPDNTTKIGYVDGLPSREDARDYFGPGLDSLVRDARAASMFMPVPAAGYFLRHGNVHRVAVSAVTRENPIGPETERHDRDVLIYARHFSGDFLNTLSTDFAVGEMTIVMNRPTPNPARLSMALAAPGGEAIAWLTWNAPRPGAAIIGPLRVWRAIAVVIVLALSLLFVRQVLRTARGLADRNRQLMEKDRQLAQTSKLALLGEMAAGLVHELNQPLNIIRMATERTRGKYRVAEGDSDSETIGSQLEIIAGQIERMSETIQSMRIFSRDDYGRKVAFDPVQSVTQAVGWLRPDFDKRGISLDVEAPTVCGRVFGEPARVEQVIVNLLLNARDAVEQNTGGSDPARNVRVTVTDDPARERVIVAVRDNGPGIPAAHIDRVFEPFFTTKDPGSGTGLGLSISYGIVSGMNGTLLAENTEAGALFRVELPRIMPADEAGASGVPIDLE